MHVSMCYSAGDLGDLERRILDLSMKVLCPTGKYFTQVCGIMTRLKHKLQHILRCKYNISHAWQINIS